MFNCLFYPKKSVKFVPLLPKKRFNRSQGKEKGRWIGNILYLYLIKRTNRDFISYVGTSNIKFSIKIRSD